MARSRRRAATSGAPSTASTALTSNAVPGERTSTLTPSQARSIALAATAGSPPPPGAGFPGEARWEFDVDAPSAGGNPTSGGPTAGTPRPVDPPRVSGVTGRIP